MVIKIGLKIKENLLKLFAYICLIKLKVFSLAIFLKLKKNVTDEDVMKNIEPNSIT